MYPKGSESKRHNMRRHDIKQRKKRIVFNFVFRLVRHQYIALSSSFPLKSEIFLGIAFAPAPELLCLTIAALLLRLERVSNVGAIFAEAAPRDHE